MSSICKTKDIIIVSLLWDVLDNTQDKRQVDHKSGIYKIKHNNCNTWYMLAKRKAQF